MGDKGGGRYADLLRNHLDLQRRYDELRIVMARMGIPDPDTLKPERESRVPLTLIKGGLAAFGGWLLLHLRHHVRTTALVASTATISTLSVWAVASHNPPTLIGSRRRPGVAQEFDGDGRVVAPPVRSGVRVTRPVPAVEPSSGNPVAMPASVPSASPVPQPTQTQAPAPQPSPTPPPPTMQPTPLPSPTGNTCVAWVVVNGVRVCARMSAWQRRPRTLGSFAAGSPTGSAGSGYLTCCTPGSGTRALGLPRCAVTRQPKGSRGRSWSTSPGTPSDTCQPVTAPPGRSGKSQTRAVLA